ncbi:DUF2785 domain-containing protein [Oceanobacillus sp. 1P07AA]|uniref:DUF2785 domain-containing protein n=1 Tax=Oceanobacillus sp. 1P07AA TaxID=3132293 RepID=UPI0039A702FC
MLSETDFKTKLKRIYDAEKVRLGDNDLEYVVNHMLRYIGSTDSELRDNLIYPYFYKLLRDDCLSKEHWYRIIEVCIGEDYLFYKIDEGQSDGVFKRSFTVLVIGLFLEKDKEKRYFDEIFSINVMKAVISYIEQEKDTRGFVEGKGWAHSVAHVADVFCIMTEHHYFNEKDIPKVLSAIKTSIMVEHPYIDDEEVRLSFILPMLLKKELGENIILNWFNGINEDLEMWIAENKQSLRSYRLKWNVINFYKASYFYMNQKNLSINIQERLLDYIHEWNENAYS